MTRLENSGLLKREQLTNQDGSNKHNLQIFTNWYKSSNEYEGNGLHTSYVEGKFCNGEVFIAYPFRGIFYLEVGKNINETTRVLSIRVSGSDLYNHYEYLPEIFFKYINQLIDSYAECIKQDCN